MKRIVSILICLISFATISESQVSRNRIKTTPSYGWPNRVVPTAPLLDSTLKSFHNIIDDGKAQIAIAPTAVKTVSYLASYWDFVPVDCSAGSFTLQLPTTPPDGVNIGCKMILTSSTNSILIKTGGSDAFNKAGGSATLQIILLNQGMTLQYKATTGIWYVTSDNLALSTLDARYTTTAVASGSYVPYSGATTSLNLGAQNFSTSGTSTLSIAVINSVVTNSISSNGNNSILFKTNGNLAWKVDSMRIARIFSTTATSTISGSFWYDGGATNGFNFMSDDPTNTGFIFAIGNTTNTLYYYADHGNTNWLAVKQGNLDFSIDGANTSRYQIATTGHGWGNTVKTTGSATQYLWTAANNTGQTASTEENIFYFAPTSVQYATGALARDRAFRLGQHTVKFVGASTLTDGANMCIEGGIIAGTNASIVNSSGLLIGGITGTTSLGAGTTNGYGLSCYAPTGATNNYSARFMNGNVGIGTSAPIFSLDVTGNARITSTLTVGGLAGTTTNDNTSAGNVGEYVSALLAVGSATTFTTATAMNIMTISLTAGDWDVQANLNFNETTSTVTFRTAGITSTSATIPTDGSECNNGVQSTVTSEKNTITIPTKRFSLSSTTTVYLVGSANFSAGSCTGYGGLTARRVR